MPAAAFFTTVPFGLTPSEHVAWVEAAGGRAALLRGPVGGVSGEVEDAGRARAFMVNRALMFLP